MDYKAGHSALLDISRSLKHPAELHPGELWYWTFGMNQGRVIASVLEDLTK